MTKILLAISVMLAVAGQAGGLAGVEPTPTVEETEAHSESASRGSRLFEIYCKSCHGERGRGDGPAAKSMSPAPPDLTRLSRDNDGKFPTALVMLVIDGRRPIPGHNSNDMPIWGLSLQEPDSDYYQEDTVRRKIRDLVAFLETLQPDKAKGH